MLTSTGSLYLKELFLFIFLLIPLSTFEQIGQKQLPHYPCWGPGREREPLRCHGHLLKSLHGRRRLELRGLVLELPSRTVILESFQCVQALSFVGLLSISLKLALGNVSELEAAPKSRDVGGREKELCFDCSFNLSS